MMRFDFASRVWIIVPVVIVVLGIGVISTSVFITQHTEHLLESDFGDTQKMLIEHLQERAFYLFEANFSIHNIARIIGSALDKNMPSSSAIDTNAAPDLFLALNTIRLASQISYVRVNEVSFSYLHERDQTRAVFSNTSSKPFNSTVHQWYTQKVDNHTGKRYGDVLVVPPIQLNESQWLFDALKGRSRSPSYGYGWGYDREEMFFFTAPVIIMALSVKNSVLLLQEMKVIIVLLLSSFILITIIGSCVSSKHFRRLERQKAYGLANLIKQKEATQQAERKSMNKSLAFASASHDVRASLAGITGLIKLCHDDVSPNSDVARNLLLMDSCASKLLGILNSVLDTSKVEAGKMQLEDMEFNMVQAIEESVDIFHVVALAKGLEVIWDPCDFSVFMSANVRGDCRRFKQILDNILSNAVKFTLEGHIIVRAWAKKASSKDAELASIQQGQFSNISASLSRWFCNTGGAYSNKNPLNSTYHGQGGMEFIFEVEDTGTGIPKDKRTSIFENYVQVNDSTLGYEGTGLGLGIVQSYVRLMGGDIGIHEKEPGERGSCFVFNIFLKSIDISSNKAGESFGSSKIPILNRLNSFSSKTRVKVQSNIHALAISQGVIVEGIQCLLVINGAETRRILKDWMGHLGIMVSVAEQPENMCAALKGITYNCSVSGRFDLSLPSSDENNDFSGLRDKSSQFLPVSMKDASKNASSKVSHKYLLVILDLGFDANYGWI